MLVVVALGGNALPRRGEAPEAGTPLTNVRHAVAAIAEVASGHRVVVTHGNGPQIGLLALQSEANRDLRAYPLDILGAETEGMIGYMIEQELGNTVPGRRVASILTQVVVDVMDPAFRAPTKPIGPVYREAEARRLAAERGWHVAAAGDGWRRVVASPTPRAIVELAAIRILLDAGALVVCAGGGGIPVVVDSHGARHGVEAVIDKDRSSALLARGLGADALLLLTDVPAVMRHWGTPDAHPIPSATADDLRSLQLDPGSMGPKASAAAWFAATTGGFAGIGAIDDASEIIHGRAGTVVEAVVPEHV
ncbi:MAG: carbamate kinase [Acidimicrobiia bacterium]|nr:carbamate kinase [Acidimicrobiia bacterium]